MKKIFLTLALLASIQIANAQDGKNFETAQKNVEVAQKAADDAKKSTKMATWLKLGQTLMEAYEAPKGVGQIGQTKQELDVLMATIKAKSTKTVTVGGKQLSRKMYPTANYYFGDGKLQMIEITKRCIDDALPRALKAYSKAYELDTKAQKTKDITNAINKIAEAYTDEAYNAYAFGKNADAAKYFEASVEARNTAPVSKLDTNAIFNAGFAYWLAGNMDKAKVAFEKCLSYNYYGEGGEVYAKLADIADKAGDKDGSVKILETGFAKFPASQSLLVGLINYYVNSGANSDKLFELLASAKKNEPKNASLYYVEGQAREKLGQIDKAMEAYEQCSKVNPKYEYGYIGKAVLLYDKAVKIQEEAQKELDDNKYMALAKEFEATLKSCIDPFEKAFELTKDKGVKKSLAEYLKNACFRFRTSDPEFQAKYDKYNTYSTGGAK